MAPPIGVACGIGIGLGGSYNQAAAAIAAIKAVGGSLIMPGLDDWQDSVGGTAAVEGAVLGVINDDGIGLYPATQATAANKPTLQRVPILGPELVVNGTGDNATGWTTNSTLTVTGGEFVLTSTAASGTAYARKTIATTAGVTYLLGVTQRRGTAVNSISTSFRDSSFSTIGSGLTNATTTNTVAQGVFVATTNPSYVNVAFSPTVIGEAAYFDNISVREIIGYRNVYTANFDGLTDVMTTGYGWTLSDGLAITWCGAVSSASNARILRARTADNTSGVMLALASGSVQVIINVAGVMFYGQVAPQTLGEVGVYSATLTSTQLILRKNGVVIGTSTHGLTLNGASLYASIGGDTTFCNNNTYAVAITKGASASQLLQIERGLASLAGITI